MNPEIRSAEHERRRRRLIRLRGLLPAIGAAESDVWPCWTEWMPDAYPAALPPLTVPIGELVQTEVRG